jgi:hypothetical protein
MTEIASEERLTQLLTSCLIELLRGLGVEPTLCPERRCEGASGKVLAAFVGFGDDDLRGSFSLVGESRLFARLYPLAKSDDPQHLMDWACEMANQAVGRLRNRARLYGVRLTAGAPQSALAERVRLSPSLRPSRTPIVLGIDDMVLETWLELDLRPSVHMADQPNEDNNAGGVAEGDVLLF